MAPLIWCHGAGRELELPLALSSFRVAFKAIILKGTCLEVQLQRYREISNLPATGVSNMPFKEQHLKQLRAQCLVFLAFRNCLMPKKLHLEIALGNFSPKEDGPSKELIDNKEKELYINDQSNIPEGTMLFDRQNDVRQSEIVRQGTTSTGAVPEAIFLKESKGPNIIREMAESQEFLPMGS
ncbi:hypothetical protein Vadar_029609 [Vaccinium darrowii]|uniref:Uncharacterized protein n=1 Tax=Vaccinium darrowii TaxID=229202 RepID=A0ACB7XKW4_9ERIC|nr:hypothetical protein Vadar_029609 [Vaccinium darrowii]